MRKITLILYFAITILLSSCSNEEESTVSYANLSESERNIASFTSDYFSQHILEKNKSYEVIIRLYEKGIITSEIGRVSDIYSNSKDIDLMLCGQQQDGTASIEWSLSSNDVVTTFAPPILPEITGLSIGNDIGKEHIYMDDDKEYLLKCVVFTSEGIFEMNTFDKLKSWEELKNPNEILNKFDYAYIVTIKLH